MTGLAGNPSEYFAQEAEETLYRRWGVSAFGPFLNMAIKEGTSSNGVFGFKIMVADFFQHLIRRMREASTQKRPNLPDVELLSQSFPNLRYIWLTRSNKVRQAVSLLRSIQKWDLVAGLHQQPKVLRGKPRYRFAVIDLLIQRIVTYESMLQEFFTRNKIKPQVIFFEEFISSEERIVLQVLDYLGIRVPDQLSFRGKLAVRPTDDLSREWVERYLREKSKLIVNNTEHGQLIQSRLPCLPL